MVLEPQIHIHALTDRNSFCFTSFCPLKSFPFVTQAPIKATSARASRYCRWFQNRSLFLTSSGFRTRSTLLNFPLCRGERNIAKPRCTLVEESANSTLDPTRLLTYTWTEEINTGSVLEIWSKGAIRFGYVSSISERAIGVNLVRFSNNNGCAFEESKISFGEVISIWPKSITPSSLKDLASTIEMGLNFLRNSPPRSLDLSHIYSNMRRIPKGNPKALQDSYQIALSQFPIPPSAARKRHAAVTAAAGILIASDSSRFKRAAPGSGWRALPPSVAECRSRSSFIDLCKMIIENPSNCDIRRPAAWSREQLDMLREIEFVAAGGGEAKGKAAAALESLGYHPTDDGATRLLLDLEFWSTGPVQADNQRRGAKHGTDIKDLEFEMSHISTQEVSSGNSPKKPENREWAFPPPILNDAREIRSLSRQRRYGLSIGELDDGVMRHRRLLQVMGKSPLRVYCIDDKNARFLDDAFSVQLSENGKRARFLLHITDVDEIVKSGSAIDDLARERGMSLYLPLRPLHMLPAAAMEAASFSSTLPTEAITIQIDFELENESILAWEIFPSLVPPVKRFSYKQFDAVLKKDDRARDVARDEVDDLILLARIAPLLANKLDNRRPRREQKADGNELDKLTKFERKLMDSKSIASVRFVKNKERSSSKPFRTAKVVDFQSHGAHGVVDDFLTSAGFLMRQFARQNRVCLPEGRGAASYVARCGTAPLRRYADLTIQRQIKSVLFGKKPAGRRQMAELRAWLAKRHSSGEKTVIERRRSALFESLSAHCAQQSAVAGSNFAILRGRVRNTTITKTATLKIDVILEGTGLSTMVTVSGQLLTSILKHSRSTEKSVTKADRHQMILSAAQSILASGSRVRVQILNIDTSARTIDGTAFELLT
ncbi:Ribonuclease II/R [Gracilaria domingensis]|nr:Ribonuclease II/R [Gracilaria domingensis]